METSRTADARELRGRCDISVEFEADIVTRVEVARIVAEEWKRRALNVSSTICHTLSCVLAALDGETDPAKLGVEEGSEACNHLLALRQADSDVWEVEVEPMRSGMWSWRLVRNDEMIVAPGVNLSRELAISAARSRARRIVRREGAAQRFRFGVEK